MCENVSGIFLNFILIFGSRKSGISRAGTTEIFNFANFIFRLCLSFRGIIAPCRTIAHFSRFALIITHERCKIVDRNQKLKI